MPKAETTLHRRGPLKWTKIITPGRTIAYEIGGLRFHLGGVTWSLRSKHFYVLRIRNNLTPMLRDEFPRQFRFVWRPRRRELHLGHTMVAKRIPKRHPGD